ncbi:uncharacterized protein LOC123564176 [Mercenaria mercenaria]|uniref:uncharacterized protein LOC123564176 n=1 Tax=Mercenaria mercenaria TaxID=6596 RepID=UPI00234F1E5D|nr:uncharacterized protein LOC123564176 [Mercenaria mercenaria]
MSRNHPSLNDCLQSTPPELNDLTAILVRFRLKQYAVVTDIEKAFLHIGLHENDRDMTRFLWLSDPTNPESALKTYRFKSVLFGAVCSPFILNATLLKHLQRKANTWVSNRLQSDLYVDNFLSSLDKETDVISYFHQSRDLMSEAGFTLRSWNSNSHKLRDTARQLNILDKDEVTKLLGLRWEPETDIMTYPERPIETTAITTKRYILQSTSRIYDPLGFLTSITVKAKILLQDIWKDKFDWITMLPRSYQQRWLQIATDLNTAMKTQFQRYYFAETDDNQDAADDTKLHIFVDASTQSYDATAYICRRNHSSLVMAKNRVAPFKPLLPKLELMAAVIGARLSQHLRKALGIDKIDYWSDSQIVLHWLSNPEKTNRFIRRRVEEIKNQTGTGSWRYCPTQNNPADLLIRGISASQYQDNKLWFTGPPWLTDEINWPKCKVRDTTVLSKIQPEDDQHTRISRQPTPQIPDTIDVSRFNNLQKLFRVTAYVRRFIDNCRTQHQDRLVDAITVTELREAEMNLIRQCQSTVYNEVIEKLRSGKSRLPLVRQLRLYIDREGYIRCGGRIHNAPLNEYTRFPILLPAKHPLTRLIVLDAHQKQLHSGISATICHLRQRYWIQTIRQCVKSLLRRCITCRKINSPPYSAPDPPPLPAYRVESSPPFTTTGVDYSGALFVKSETGLESKAYVCLFTCAATRAIHLELVHDLTENSFIQAFRRFVSRRSLPRMIISDNAATFHAASNTLKTMFQTQTLRNHINRSGTEWKFIPTRAPWFGGWWERMVGLVKTSLKKVLGRAFVTFEALQTTLTEVEAILNDRPLTYVISENTDPEPITPSHLLTGRRITAISDATDPSTIIRNQQIITKRVRVQHELIHRWWARLKSDYVTSLRERHTQSGRNEQTIRIGDVVQVHDDSSRLLWKLAVEELVPGRDGLIRAAKIRTGSGHTIRPIVRLYPLKINENERL